MAPGVAEQLAERRRQLVMLMAQANRDRELIATARAQIHQLDEWLHTLEGGVEEKDRAIAETNAEIQHLDRLRVEQGGQPVPAAPRVVKPPPRPTRETPVVAPVPSVGASPLMAVAAPAPPVVEPLAPVVGTEVAPEETREHTRRSVCARVELEGDTNFFVGFSQNISEGGLFVATYDTNPPGTRFRLTFTLPTHPREIHAAVEVTWVREFRDGQDLSEGVLPGMGVRFLDVSEEDRRAIARFIQVREPLFLPME